MVILDLTKFSGRETIPGHLAKAIQAVPRHHFLAEEHSKDAYKNVAVPIGHGVNATRPSVVIQMLELLGERSKVLEVGTGCGWQTALISTFAEVFSIEQNPSLHERAARDLRDYPVSLRCGNGFAGWPEAAPFDGVIVCCAMPEVPASLIAQLSDDGVMVLPLGDASKQTLCRVTKHQDIEDCGSCGFAVAIAS